MESYIEAQIKSGNLKGKQVVLFSCYQQGDPNLVHRMISEGGAKEVIFYAETIKAEAVNAVIGELAQKVSTQEEPNSSKQIIDLLDSSVETVIHRSATPAALKEKVTTLRARVPQLSSVQRASELRAA